ncbi:MAG: hypothetical protein ACHQ53_06130 [Polyangiales bacterium]
MVLALLSAAGRAGADAGDAPVRLDGLAAVVGGTGPGPGIDVVLQSDVELRARIAWSGRTQGPLELGPLPSNALGASLNEIVGELLIAREARRVQAAMPGAVAIERERKRLAFSAGGPERLRLLLEALAASEDELDAIARRRALVGDFLSANLTGVTVVTDSEVERAYDAQRQAFAGVDRADALRELRARLSRQALDRTIERWVTVLRSRTPVRTYVVY